jgi:signal transduction histidine kinase/DNA-binding response OmpR family regulator
MKPRRSLSLRALGLGSLALICTIIGSNVIFLSNLRESSLQTAEANLARDSLMLVEEADRSFKSVDLVLSSVGDYLGRREVTDSASYQRIMSDQATHLLLKEKITGLPQIDAVTMINAQGKLINFSRYWPIPDVNVSDRDYFKALKADPNLETFISAPVQNRGSGTWNIYIARRLNDPNGEFMGLLLGAMSLQYFENFFGSTSLGVGSSVSLVREEGTLLASYPHSENIGKQFSNLGQRALAAGGNIRELSANDQTMRIRSARMLPNYPVLVEVAQTEDNVLRSWRGMAELLGAMSLVSTVVVLIAVFVIARWWKKQLQLTQAAEAANAAKSAFLAMMSHEIRTPMNAVLGLTTTLLETNLDAEQQGSVLAIHDAGDSLLVILNDILDYSKLEAGRLSLEHIAFSPEALVQNTLSIIGPRASAKGLVIRSVNDSVLPLALKGDAGRIRQVLLNLLSNAVKFTATGEVVVSTRCLAQDGKLATIEWAVSDTGIGIAPENIGNLFANFVQADNSISRRFGGSGLGLAICKRLVEQMGGEIKVISTPGQGSTFRFSLTLPVAEHMALPEHDDQTVYAELKTRIAALGRPLRVLIVDDDATNRLVAAKMLKEFEVQNNMACDGVEAITAASSFSYDVILMDVRMPEMDGLQATRTIRARAGRLQTVPIIAFTANAFAEDVEACREAGMNDLVVKPVRKKVMVEAILRVLSSHAPAADTDPAVVAPPLVPAEAPSTDAPSPFDCKAFDNLVLEIGKETALETLSLLVQETEDRLKLLRKLSSDADRSMIELEAHSLKSAAGTFGLREVAQLARALERDAAHITEGDYRVLLDRIEAAFSSARTQYLASVLFSCTGRIVS